MSSDSCSIDVEVPPNASREKIEAAIKEKLKTKWIEISKCKEKITINVTTKHSTRHVAKHDKMGSGLA
jgi:hypothetical protein